MQVKTSVHESVLDQVKPGLSVGVRVDAFPDRLYPGTVKSVAVLPDQGGYFGSDTKVYQTIITIDEPVERLKPGMTAVAEIHVDRLENVLAVPVQAIVQVGKEIRLLRRRARGLPQRRVVKLGRTNDKVVQILEGVGPGQRVVLNPMAIAEEARKPADAAAEETEDRRRADLRGARPAAGVRRGACRCRIPPCRGRQRHGESLLTHVAEDRRTVRSEPDAEQAAQLVDHAGHDSGRQFGDRDAGDRRRLQTQGRRADSPIGRGQRHRPQRQAGRRRPPRWLRPAAAASGKSAAWPSTG